MKKIYSILLLLLVMAHGAWATNIVSGTKYRMVSAKWGSGNVILGQLHSLSAPIYYDAFSTTDPADAYWVFTLNTSGYYTISNATTGQYLQYSETRINTQTRGLVLSTTATSTYAQWKLTQAGDYVSIDNVGAAGQSIDVRIDGSYIVGTYATSGSANQLFSLVSEGGSNVLAGNQIDDFGAITINGLAPIYDARGGQYMFTAPSSAIGTTAYTTTVAYTPSADTTLTTLCINGTPVASGSTYSFALPLSSSTYTLAAVSSAGDTLAKATLIGTHMPIVELTTAADINGTTYTLGSIKVTDPEKRGNAGTLLNARLRYRGATAQSKQKKAFAIKLVDAAGSSLDGEFFGLREDNNWILDAMAVDVARMRNRVATDLWNDFSVAPYHIASEKKALTATRGHFVEVILDGKYHGIYCMTEKVDRKQLKLKKFSTTSGTSTTRGILYKSDHWSYAVFMGHESDKEVFPGYAPPSYSNTSETWQNFEMQYPDVTDGEPITWEPLYNAITAVASNDTATFAQKADTIFDLNTALDYYLFIELLLATDNHGKNMFYYIYDRTLSTKLGIAPWDLDGTWGRDYYGTINKTQDAAQDFVSFLWQYEHGEHTLYKRLRETPYFDWTSRLATRYAELRGTHFTAEALAKRFNDYFLLFQSSGADTRERTRWTGVDGFTINIPTEVSYITSWIPTRIAALDAQYSYSPLGIGSATHTTPSAPGLQATGTTSGIIINAPQATTVRIYDLTGKTVRTAQVPTGLSTIDAIPAGIYIINKQKVVVR